VYVTEADADADADTDRVLGPGESLALAGGDAPPMEAAGSGAVDKGGARLRGFFAWLDDDAGTSITSSFAFFKSTTVTTKAGVRAAGAAVFLSFLAEGLLITVP
jgi:hypothetical protein